jgi:1-acyl-sn-glycerol-3-phosphate acyltransferase
MGKMRHLSDFEEEIHPPSKEFVAEMSKPLKAWFSPRIYGLEKVEKDRPALYVSNHSVLGVTDGFFLGAELYMQKDILLRPLVDELHSEVPFWRQMIRNVGMVTASRESCNHLMEQGEHILVFPGGRREVCKQKGEAYQLIWRNRVGFVYMALSNGYDIIPVATLGAEEMFEILVDSKDIMRSPFGAWLQNTGIADRFFHGGENIPPLVKGVGRSLLPKPERHYIMVGDRISTKELQEHAGDENILKDLRKQVEGAFELMFEDLRAYRENDKDEEWWRKLLKGM